MSVAPRLCWVLVSAIPYHEARMRAAAEHMSLRLCMVQLAGFDAFEILQQPAQAGEKYDRRILFPDKRWHEINGRSMAQSLRALLNELRPNVVCINGWSYGGCIAALARCVAHRLQPS